MTVTVFCHECNGTSRTADETNPICATCGSSFVEIMPAVRQGPEALPAALPARMGQRQTRHVVYQPHDGVTISFHSETGPGFSFGPGMGPSLDPHLGAGFPFGPMLMPMGGPGMASMNLHNVLAAIQQMVAAQSGGGDFVIGPNGQAMPMDALMTQIMQQYQPQFVATDPRARRELPRLKVAPAGSRQTLSAAVDKAARAPTVAAGHSDAAAKAAAAAMQRAAAAGAGVLPAASIGVTDGHAAAAAAASAPQGEGSTPEGYANACVGDTCTICHDDYSEDTVVVELPCQHCFHEDCIMPWLETHNTCPVCRKDLPADPTATPPPPFPGMGDPSALQNGPGMVGLQDFFGMWARQQGEAGNSRRDFAAAEGDDGRVEQQRRENEGQGGCSIM